MDRQTELILKGLAMAMREVLNDNPGYASLTIHIREGYIDVTMGSDSRLIGFTEYDGQTRFKDIDMGDSLERMAR